MDDLHHDFHTIVSELIHEIYRRTSKKLDQIRNTPTYPLFLLLHHNFLQRNQLISSDAFSSVNFTK